MADIYLGLGIIFSLALVVFLLAVWMTRLISRRLCNVLAALTIVGILLYIQFLWYNVHLTRILPFSNLIILGNWLPIAAGFLAGLAWQTVPGNAFRRSLPVIGLSVAGTYAAIAPLLGNPPKCEKCWTSKGVCLQTTKHTCTAACAATLLRLYGIEANEQEMATLCLTRQGTTWMGLYRGLKKKTAGTPWDVEVVTCRADQLHVVGSVPMILNVGLDASESVDAAYRDERGWIPGIDHSVVLMDFIGPNQYEIADPAPGIGREMWSGVDLQMLWRGYGLRLIPRPAGPSGESTPIDLTCEHKPLDRR